MTDYTSSTEIEAFGVVGTLAEWSWIVGLGERVLQRRLRDFHDVSVELVLSMPSYLRADPAAAAGQPHSWTWDSLPWERDPWARAWVKQHPGGSTLEEVASALGVTRERVRQIEEVAMRKLRHVASERGLEVAEMLCALRELRDGRSEVML